MPKRVVRIRGVAIAAACLALAAASASADETVRLFAAESLKSALTEIARDFEARQSASFGASGLLKRLEQGEAADLFASANMEHPAR